MFRVGDKIVHPMHGAGVVDEIVTRKVDGVLRDYYSLKLPIGGMQVMIPTDHCGAIGVRSILSGAETEWVLGQIPPPGGDGPQLEPPLPDQYGTAEKRKPVGSGQSGEGPHGAGSQAGPVYGERKMLHAARQMLASEVGLAQSISYQEAEDRIERALHS